MPGGRKAPRAKIAREALDYGLLNPRFEYAPKRKTLNLICDTPSGEVYKVKTARWQQGVRPPQRFMRDIPAELAEYGLTFVEFFFKNPRPKPNHRFLRAVSPAGEEYVTRVSHWVTGAAKPPLKYRRNIQKEVEDYGLLFEGITLARLSNGSQCSMLHFNNNGELGTTKVSDWFLGSRPGRTGGKYKGSYLADHPEQGSLPVTLYFLRFHHKEDGETFYKVGLTASTIRRRFYDAARRGYAYTVLSSTTLPLKEALQIEQDTIRNNKHVQYIPSDRFPNGRTECFSEDVFSLAVMAT